MRSFRMEKKVIFKYGKRVSPNVCVMAEEQRSIYLFKNFIFPP